MKLLIVDDHPANLRLLRAQLESEGHQVIDATNGAEGLRLLRKDGAEGVISDILMPEMDGYRFCIEVRGDPTLRGLPFVLYTSTYNSPADRQLALNAGADAYISKPAPVPVVLQALRDAAARKRPGSAKVAGPQTDVLKKYSEVLVRKLEDKNLELEKSLERLSLIHDIDQAIIGSRTPAQVAEAVLPRLRDLLGMPRVIVNMFDLEKNEVEWLVAVGRKHTHVGPGVRYSLDVMGDLAGLKRGEAQRIDVGALTQRQEADALLASGVRWFMVAPMIVGEELIGGLSFGGPSPEFTSDTLEIARHAAAQLALAIHHARLGERARRADAQYRLVFENVPVGITMTGLDGKIVSANIVSAQMLGYETVERALVELGNDSSQVYVDLAVRGEYVRRLQRDRVVRDYEVELRRRDGSRFWASLDGRLVPDSQGNPLSFITIIDDISVRREQEYRISRLSRVKAMHSGVNTAIVRTGERQALLDATCQVAVEQGGFRAAWIVWHDEERRRLSPVASAGHLEGFLDKVATSTDMPASAETGFSLHVLRNRVAICTNDLRTDPNVAFRQEALERGYRATMHLPLTSGGETKGVLVLCASEANFFDAEERQLLEELATDVSFALESLQKSERLEYLAYYDLLTGLPNRGLFHDRLSHSLRSRGGDARLIAMVLLDLARFRRVNETLGRGAGDELLKRVAARLRELNDSAARIGVDMYGLVLRGARTVEEVNRTIEALIATCFAEPFQVNGGELSASCRVGVALHPDDGADADVLMRNAEAALRGSKRSGERIVFYTPEMNARVADALAMENKLRRATERREFVLHYQPKIAMANRRIVGAEALIRWQDPDKGLVPPGHFIPVLEETGMIVEVGRWALEQTFADLNAWTKQGIVAQRVAVNVSSIQLQRKDFVDTVIEEIERGGDRPELLELEITESLVMRNVEDSTRKLSILRGMGVTIAIDDFGTGYSSLAYLARLPLDSLKIDRSFVSAVATSGESTMLITTMIGLAHGLKLKVVAEGVEAEDQARMLTLFRCDEAQGYFYSRPVPAEAFAVMLQKGITGP